MKFYETILVIFQVPNLHCYIDNMTIIMLVFGDYDKIEFVYYYWHLW